MLARYEGAYAATTVVVMGDRSGFAWQDPPANNHLDTLVYAKLKGQGAAQRAVDRCRVPPPHLPRFVRRAPAADAVRAFLADTRDTKVKRDELIDRLVGGGEYVDHWTNKWADLLQVNRKFLGEQGAWPSATGFAGPSPTTCPTTSSPIAC